MKELGLESRLDRQIFQPDVQFGESGLTKVSVSSFQPSYQKHSSWKEFLHIFRCDLTPGLKKVVFPLMDKLYTKPTHALLYGYILL